MTDEQEFLKIQNELREKISLEDSFRTEELRTVAGVDLAYWQFGGDEYAVCCIVVIDFKTHEVLEKKHFSGKIDVPYMAGFLAFRELPLVIKTAALLESSPDLFVFDGNGYLHPRRMGIATHASFHLGKPTVGIAKTYFRIDKKTDYTEPENSPGSFTDIIIDGEVCGRALRTHIDVKPVFVSVGNGISIDTACALAMELTEKDSHIPIPTRLADLETHIEREKASQAQKAYAGIREKLCGLAQEDADIKAVAAIGSSVRSDPPADEYSDLDIILVTEAPEKWFSGEYPALLGNMTLSFIEPTLGGGYERRCIYDSDRDVDIIILTPAQFETAIRDGTVGSVMNRGYLFLCDKNGYAALAGEFVKPEITHPALNEGFFQNAVNDFFFHNIWSAKKLLRGELWAAKMCIDTYLKLSLLFIIEQYQLLNGTDDIWHNGRFLDRWADRSITRELSRCFAHYDIEDCKKALKATHRLFARLAASVAEKSGFRYPAESEKCAADFLRDKL